MANEMEVHRGQKASGKTAGQMDGWSKKSIRELDARGSGWVGKVYVNRGRDMLCDGNGKPFAGTSVGA